MSHKNCHKIEMRQKIQTARGCAWQVLGFIECPNSTIDKGHLRPTFSLMTSKAAIISKDACAVLLGTYFPSKSTNLQKKHTFVDRTHVSSTTLPIVSRYPHFSCVLNTKLDYNNSFTFCFFWPSLSALSTHPSASSFVHHVAFIHARLNNVLFFFLRKSGIADAFQKNKIYI